MNRVRCLRWTNLFLAVVGIAWSAHITALAQDSLRPKIASIEELGAALFADRNLSLTRRQACVSCHSPELAFTDPRELGAVEGAVSRGDDGRSLGDRNAPTLTYVYATPRFNFFADDEPVGGQFLDGRADHLEDQAGAPLLNPAEMAMPDRASIVARIQENPSYVRAFRTLFESYVLDDVDRAYGAVSRALAAFERSPSFASFDSKYDRFLRGEATLSDIEQKGLALFFASPRADCARCHSSAGITKAEVFSNFRYYNIGVPANSNVRELNGIPKSFIDVGVAVRNPGAPRLRGRFKVPTLRNVAVTAPYMHNGYSKDLADAILMHTRVALFDGGASIASPEVPENVVQGELSGEALDQSDLAALVAFLETLTDARYEHLLP